MKIEKYNESHLRVFASRDVLYGIKDFFTFKAPGYQFSPKFKQKIWDGNVSLFNIQTNKLPVGLHDLLLQYAERVEEEVEYIPNQNYKNFEPENIDYDEFLEFVKGLNLSDKKGDPITAKPYQISAAYSALNNRRMTLSMPTGSGKSLTIYIIIRWMIKHEMRTVLLVPSISLVKQMVSDFIEYSLLNGFNVDEYTNLLYNGQEKDFGSFILVSTWQSMSKMIKTSYGVKALNSYDCMIVDEAHTAKGTEFQKILELATEISFRIGTTGTVDNKKINELMIVGGLGPINKIITTKELMDEGHLSDMEIKAL
ncbi:MAG TPA: DEAD/DEAH box helicase family protein, partial [Methanosarcina sp.]|nr:DEAD/DEAH box helicase family protein [Methanosarcina sp.]